MVKEWTQKAYSFAKKRENTNKHRVYSDRTCALVRNEHNSLL